MLVDTHCHLNFESFDGDRAAVLVRAREADLVRILNPGINVPSSREAINLSEAHPEVFAAVGVHPNEALSWQAGTFTELQSLARHPKVVAIGEIGLDYYRDRAPRDVQRRVFRQQLELAAELDLPVVLHSRNTSSQNGSAIMDMLGILTEWQTVLIANSSPLVERPGVLHSYSGNIDSALRAVDLGFWIGITGPITFRKADELRQVVASLPVNRLLIETDAPFLTPHPFRGQRNEPAYVRFVADKIAQIHNLPFDVVANITVKSAERLFNWRVTG